MVDLNTHALTERDLGWTDIVLISAMIAQRDSAEGLLARSRAADNRILAEGPLFTGAPPGFPGGGHFVLNDAEITLPEFLRNLEKGPVRRVYERTHFTDLSRSPVPCRDSIEVKRYGSMAGQWSRGCPIRLRMLRCKGENTGICWRMCVVYRRQVAGSGWFRSWLPEHFSPAGGVHPKQWHRDRLTPCPIPDQRSTGDIYVEAVSRRRQRGRRKLNRWDGLLSTRSRTCWAGTRVGPPSSLGPNLIKRTHHG